MPNEIQPAQHDEPDYSHLSASLTEVDDAQAGRFSRSASSLLWEPGKISVELDPRMPMEFLLSLSDRIARVIAIRTLIRFVSRISPSLGQLLRRHDLQQIERTFRTFQRAERSEFNRPHFLILQFPATVDVVQVSREMARFEMIRHAAPMPRMCPPATPENEPWNTPNLQWYLYRCGVPSAWQLASGASTVVADIDWGFRVTHNDLRSKIGRRYNSFDDSKDVSHGENVKHGTAVLGQIGAADNDLGIAGIAYAADLWAIQADSGLGPQQPGDPWAIAIDWVIKEDSGGKRKVLLIEAQTSELNNIESHRPVWRAIKDAIAKKVIVCIAAGNGGNNAEIIYDNESSAESATGSILVGATEFHRTSNPPAEYSNWGKNVVVSAPGDLEHDVTCSSAADNQYLTLFGGTSGAASKVAGAIALMLEVNPALDQEQVKHILEQTGAPITPSQPDRPIGVFLNVGAAVEEAKRRA
jgi:subtilisin family serine protease